MAGDDMSEQRLMDTLQIQRQETTLAQDPHRHLDDSPSTGAKMSIHFFSSD